MPAKKQRRVPYMGVDALATACSGPSGQARPSANQQRVANRQLPNSTSCLAAWTRLVSSSLALVPGIRAE
jgi:hypothetical protein